MSVTSAVLADSSKNLVLLNLFVPVMHIILLFVIPPGNLFLISLVIVSHLKLFVHVLMLKENMLINELLLIKAVANVVLQNHSVP